MAGTFALLHHYYAVMAGLVPAIHVFFIMNDFPTWMPGTSPGITE
jgi:hypothetical protein